VLMRSVEGWNVTPKYVNCKSCGLKHGLKHITSAFRKLPNLNSIAGAQTAHSTLFQISIHLFWLKPARKGYMAVEPDLELVDEHREVLCYCAHGTQPQTTSASGTE
jgi:hypothetical protein